MKEAPEAIAAYESSPRLSNGNRLFPTLVLSQNEPFAPIVDTWKSKTREWRHLDEEVAKRHIDETLAKTLSNRPPPYSDYGGLFDTLQESNGVGVSVTNGQALAARKSFRELEGINIASAAAVAFASLLDSLPRIPCDAIVLLNILGRE
jgi:cysteate synthase